MIEGKWVQLAGGEVTLEDTVLGFGNYDFSGWAVSSGSINLKGASVRQEAYFELDGIDLSGGLLDLTGAVIGSSIYDSIDPTVREWVADLCGRDVDSRKIVYGSHPTGHLSIANSKMSGGEIRFTKCDLRGGLVELYGLTMTNGAIDFEECMSDGTSVVNFFNSDISGEATVRMNVVQYSSPIVMHTQKYGGVIEKIVEREHVEFLEVSAAD